MFTLCCDVQGQFSNWFIKHGWFAIFVFVYNWTCSCSVPNTSQKNVKNLFPSPYSYYSLVFLMCDERGTFAYIVSIFVSFCKLLHTHRTVLRTRAIIRGFLRSADYHFSNFGFKIAVVKKFYLYHELQQEFFIFSFLGWN